MLASRWRVGDQLLMVFASQWRVDEQVGPTRGSLAAVRRGLPRGFGSFWQALNALVPPHKQPLFAELPASLLLQFLSERFCGLGCKRRPKPCSLSLHTHMHTLSPSSPVPAGQGLTSMIKHGSPLHQRPLGSLVGASWDYKKTWASAGYAMQGESHMAGLWG